MPVPFDTDPSTSCHFILYEALLKTPVFEGFQKLCKAIGEDVISYAEYEILYYRYYHGDRNMNYDKSADQNPMEFSDLPMDALSEILKRLDSKERFIMRKVSKKLQETVDELTIPCDFVRIADCGKFIEISSSYTQYLRYFKTTDASKRSVCHPTTIKIIAGDNYMDVALRDWEIAMKWSKLKIEKCSIETDDAEFVNKLVEKLVSMKTEIESRFLTVRSCDGEHLLSILSLFKPGVLEKIDVPSRRVKEIIVDMNRLKDMEQFKQAKSVNFNDTLGVQFSDLPLFYHLETFKVKMERVPPEDVMRLRDDLIMPSNTVESCTLNSYFEIKLAEFGRALGGVPPTNARRLKEIVQTYPIPTNPNLLLKCTIDIGSVTFEKIQSSNATSTSLEWISYPSDDEESYDEEDE